MMNTFITSFCSADCTHRQAVVVLYAVSACFALISLPLLSPGSGNIAVVLSVVGLGVFFGLQHLGYREVDELRRVARRTWGQKTIISNNLAIRRATDELALAKNAHDIIEILKRAFQGNDYDGFEISFSPELPGFYGTPLMVTPFQYGWRREGTKKRKGWEVRLDLFSQREVVCGCFSVHRSYTAAALRSDIDCFTEEFASALSAALQRAEEIHIPSVGIAAMATSRSSDVVSVA